MKKLSKSLIVAIVLSAFLHGGIAFGNGKGTLFMKLIPLSASKNATKHKGKYSAIVSDEDFEWLNQWKWSVRIDKNNNYAQRKIFLSNGRKSSLLMHRQILGITGHNILIDHKDKNGLNCQRDNIRIATYSQNNHYQRKRSNTASSKYIGVYWHTKYSNGKTYYYWKANIQKDKKLRFLGHYKCEEEAALAYNKAAIELFGEFASLNILPFVQDPYKGV